MKYLILLLCLVPGLGYTQAPNNLVLSTPNSITPGQFNTLVGSSAGRDISTAVENVFVGSAAGESTTSGSSNVFVGVRAGNANVAGQGNTLLGFYAGRSSTSANANTFVGGFAGEQNIEGGGNTYVGYFAGNAGTNARSNAFFGANAGQYNSMGSSNTFLGNSAGYKNTAGGGNVFAGFLAGYANTSGNFNVLIGLSAGENIVSGYKNVMLGSAAQPTSASIHNAVAIGANARVALDNAIVLGDPANTSIAVGIGTDSPQFPLDVRGTINLRNNGRIKFAHLSNPVQNGTTDQFLTVNEQGETVLAKYRLKIDNVNMWSDKVFATSYELRSLSSVATYISQHGHLPGVPSAEEVVKNGIDPAKMDAKLLEKVEELTLYGIQQEKKTDAQERKIQQQQREIDELKALLKQVLDKK